MSGAPRLIGSGSNAPTIPPVPEDGVLVLVDRLCSRGLRKGQAAIDHWMKAVAPSAELRRWFNHDPARWDESRRRYAEELRAHPAELDGLRGLTQAGVVALLYGAHDVAHNNAAALREVLFEPKPAAGGIPSERPGTRLAPISADLPRLRSRPRSRGAGRDG